MKFEENAINQNWTTTNQFTLISMAIFNVIFPIKGFGLSISIKLLHFFFFPLPH